MSTSSFNDNLNQSLDLWSQELGFARWGATPLDSPVSLPFYKTWIEQNYYGEMEYLKRHLPQKENPRLLNEKLQSAFAFAHHYVPHPQPQKTSDGPLRMALYAQGEDYHFWLREKLENL
jgi:epoxyqueuosine reductase